MNDKIINEIKLNKISKLFENGAKKIFICLMCGNIGSEEELLFKDKISASCPKCNRGIFHIYDWLDNILENNNINISIERSNKNVYSRRSNVELILNKEIIDKIKNGKAAKIISCPLCFGNGHDKDYSICTECEATGVIKVNKSNYMKYMKYMKKE